MSSLLGMDAHELAGVLRAGEASVREVTEAHLGRIRATDDRVGAFLRVLDEEALAHADDIDRRRAAGERVGGLGGVPLALKDVLATQGLPTTCGSRMLENYRPPYDATAVARIRAADGVVLGKTNMDEFAMGSSNENSAFGPTHNPWDLERVPGGSSGGSAAAVAAGDVPFAVGTDTGGSVRQPASFCGVVGLKPTYGLVSRYGLVAFASSLDTVGSLARTVADSAWLVEVMGGHDPCDATSLPGGPPELRTTLDDGVDGLRVGVISEFTGDGVDPRVDAAVERLDALGAEVSEVSVPHLSYGVSAYYLIAPSEASSNLARYDGVRYGLRREGATTEEMMAATREAGFGPEVKRRIMIGTYALSAGYYEAYYGQAQKVRTLIIRDLDEAFGRCDVLVAPTTPTPAFRLGEQVDDPLTMYLNDVYTNPFNLSGHPAVSLPAGTDETGLPVGVQVVAPHAGEATMLRVARALERDLAFDHTPRGANALEGRK